MTSVLLGMDPALFDFFCLMSVTTAFIATPSPVPIISPIPRLLLTASASAMDWKRPVASPSGVRTK